MLPAREASVLCGCHAVDWNAVKTAASWYEWKAGIIKNIYDTRRAIDGISLTISMNLWWRSGVGSELYPDLCGQKIRPVYKWDTLELLFQFRSCLAIEPMDRLYALLGVSDVPEKEQKSLVRPDYTGSDMEVFRDSTTAIIKMQTFRVEGSRNILISATPHSAEPGWPLWFPDWRITDIPDAGVRLRHDEPAGRYWGPNKVRYLESPDEDSLKVEGVILGKAIYVSPHRHGPQILLNGKRRATQNVCREMLKSYPTEEDVDTAFGLALIAGNIPNITNCGTTPEEYAETFIRFVEACTMPQTSEEERKRRYEAAAPYFKLGFNPNWFDLFIRAYCKRRFFITETGYMGIGNH